jgi:hypothetical protein
VKRRAYIIATLAAVLTAQTLTSSGVAGKIVNSALNFRHYYMDLEAGTSKLSPIERIVFSLVLANSKTQPGPVEQTSGGI